MIVTCNEREREDDEREDERDDELGFVEEIAIRYSGLMASGDT